MIDDIPAAILEDAAQLCKANSIQGNKMNNIDVVYTLWSNLKKTPGMEVGQVGFHKEKEVTFSFLVFLVTYLLTIKFCRFARLEWRRELMKLLTASTKPKLRGNLI